MISPIWVIMMLFPIAWGFECLYLLELAYLSVFILISVHNILFEIILSLFSLIIYDKIISIVWGH